MAYTTPRDWDGTETTLVAQYLEEMRENNLALSGRNSKVNIGFYGQELSAEGAVGQKVWYLKHKLQYLHYHLECTQGTITDIRIYVTADLSSVGTAVAIHGNSYSDGDLMTSSGNDGGAAIDLSSLTVGSFYFVVVRYTAASGSTGERLFVRNLYESSES